MKYTSNNNNNNGKGKVGFATGQFGLDEEVLDYIIDQCAKTSTVTTIGVRRGIIVVSGVMLGKGLNVRDRSGNSRCESLENSAENETVDENDDD